MDRKQLDNLMAELAQYNAILAEVEKVVEGLKDQLKSYMISENLETLQGSEHKAIYKEVAASRVDTTALKKAMPDVIALYTKTTTTKRFTFS